MSEIGSPTSALNPGEEMRLVFLLAAPSLTAFFSEATWEHTTTASVASYVQEYTVVQLHAKHIALPGLVLTGN